MNDKDFFTLEDLKSWQISSQDSYAVLGKPINHSKSPILHNGAFKKLNINAKYYKFEIDPLDIEESIYLFSKKNFKGLNLTIPHKTITFEFAKKNNFFIDKSALFAKATNTVKFEESGKISFYNTDGFGLLQSLKSVLNVNFEGANIIMIGAGGASQGAISELINQKENGENFAKIYLLNRTVSKAKDIASFFNSNLIEARQLEDLPKASQNNIIINASSLGLKENDLSPIDLFCPKANFTSENTKIFDMVYTQNNALCKMAKEKNIPYANGISMLVWQGAASFCIWTNYPNAKEVACIMFNALEN